MRDGEDLLAPDSGETGKECRVWPPPPVGPSAEDAGPPPKMPRITDQDVGCVSLGLSGLGSLCALAYIFSLNAITGGWDPFELEIGFAGSFFAAFFVGLVGWYSWEGKVGLCCAFLLPPLWVVVVLVVAAAHGP